MAVYTSSNVYRAANRRATAANYELHWFNLLRSCVVRLLPRWENQRMLSSLWVGLFVYLCLFAKF